MFDKGYIIRTEYLFSKSNTTINPAVYKLKIVSAVGIHVVKVLRH